MSLQKIVRIMIVVIMIWLGAYLGTISLQRNKSHYSNETSSSQSYQQNRSITQVASSKPTKPDQSKYEKAVIQSISSAPLLVAVIEGREYIDIESALRDKYSLKVKPRVGGGEIYVWSYNNAPYKTWIQAEHVRNEIFEVALQIGRKSQRAMFYVDLNNGAVEKQYDTFSAQIGY